MLNIIIALSKTGFSGTVEQYVERVKMWGSFFFNFIEINTPYIIYQYVKSLIIIFENICI